MLIAISNHRTSCVPTAYVISVWIVYHHDTRNLANLAEHRSQVDWNLAPITNVTALYVANSATGIWKPS